MFSKSGRQSPVLQFDQNFTRNAYFCILEPKNCKVIENSSKASLYFSPLEQKISLISLALSQKNEIEKWPRITLVQCMM